MDGLNAPASRLDDQVATAILARLAQGDKLPPERSLALELGVKRHRIRRALDNLRRQGLVDGPEPRRRAASSKGIERWTQLTNPLEVIELRMALEPGLARLAAARASALNLARLRRAASPAPGTTPGDADLTFHHAVASCAGNALAAELYAMIRLIGRDARLQFGGAGRLCPARLKQRDAEHRAVLEAIAARDPSQAERAMRDHLAQVRDIVLAHMTPGQDTA